MFNVHIRLLEATVEFLRAARVGGAVGKAGFNKLLRGHRYLLSMFSMVGKCFEQFCNFFDVRGNNQFMILIFHYS